MSYEIFHADCFDWLHDQPGNSIHGVLTDPPYGLIEFSRPELDKLRNGNQGGVCAFRPPSAAADATPCRVSPSCPSEKNPTCASICATGGKRSCPSSFRARM